MRLGIKGKQVLGVTSIVGAVVVVLSLMHLARLAQVSLEESRARAELLANAIFHRAREVGRRRRRSAATGAARRSRPAVDPRIEPLLEERHVRRDRRRRQDVAVAHADPRSKGEPLPAGGDLARAAVARPPLSQLRGDLLRAGTEPRVQAAAAARRHRVRIDPHRRLDAARSGRIWTRRSARRSSPPASALAVAVVGAMLLAQLLLRPIHVIRSGLTRLGRGEFGVRLDLESARRVRRARHVLQHGQRAAVGRPIADGRPGGQPRVGRRAPRGRGRDRQPARRAAVRQSRDARAAAGGGARRRRSSDLVGARSSASRRCPSRRSSSRGSRGPVSATFPDSRGESRERLIMTHPINDPAGELVGIMLIARNLEYLSQVQSTMRYSRKLAALGRLSAGVAHEVKNPLNAMMIHLELLRQQFASAQPATRRAAAVRARRGGRRGRGAAAGRHRTAGAPARRRHRRRDPPPRRSRAGISEVHAAPRT